MRSKYYYGNELIADYSLEERINYANKYKGIFPAGYVPTNQDIHIHNIWVDIKK